MVNDEDKTIKIG